MKKIEYLRKKVVIRTKWNEKYSHHYKRHQMVSRVEWRLYQVYFNKKFF